MSRWGEMLERNLELGRHGDSRIIKIGDQEIHSFLWDCRNLKWRRIDFGQKLKDLIKDYKNMNSEEVGRRNMVGPMAVSQYGVVFVLK